MEHGEQLRSSGKQAALRVRLLLGSSVHESSALSSMRL